ncbi:MAG: class II fructose-1,6-bisphosphate aldolase [Clostridia bacterium]|nr:class II fructose-1,6-bisphosphate aldolase [Clostridia bacterium]
MALVNTKKMFEQAYKNGYAIGAFNVNNMEIVQGITEACKEENAPVILQVSKGARAYANHTYLVKLVEAAVLECPDIPICLHLDHGPDFETCKAVIDGGFTSVMIDGSHLPFEENIALTKKVVDYAHDVAARGRYITVEGELGTLAGIEDDVKVESGNESYTKPEEVVEFVRRTGVDSLAIAIGTSHGAYKFTPEQCTVNEEGVLVPPPLRFDILKAVAEELGDFPIVLHGSSSVPQEYVKMVNENGGKMPNAIGVPEAQLREAAKLSVCKINIDSDLRLAMTGTIRKFYNEHPDKFDPREYLKPARANIKEIVRHKLRNVLGCAGKADECK